MENVNIQAVLWSWLIFFVVCRRSRTLGSGWIHDQKIPLREGRDECCECERGMNNCFAEVLLRKGRWMVKGQLLNKCALHYRCCTVGWMRDTASWREWVMNTVWILECQLEWLGKKWNYNRKRAGCNEWVKNNSNCSEFKNELCKLWIDTHALLNILKDKDEWQYSAKSFIHTFIGV